jgi:ribosome modulation factor
MYDPPSPSNWHMAWSFDESYRQAYVEGYEAAERGYSANVCPYAEHYPHERETSFTEDLQMWWHSGFDDFWVQL